MDKWVSMQPELPREGKIVKVNMGDYVGLALFEDGLFHCIRLQVVKEGTQFLENKMVAWCDFGNSAYIVRSVEDA